VSNRIWAGKELAKLGTRPALRALREALKVEPFWGVRVQLAKALANQKNAGIFVSEILAEMITSESDARAFMPILDSCSSIRYVCMHTHSHIGDPSLTQHLLYFYSVQRRGDSVGSPQVDRGSPLRLPRYTTSCSS
jgi:hypothetical protein